MTISNIEDDLKRIETIFRDLIVTTNFKRISTDEISWDNYKSGIFKNIYAKEYEFIVKNRQYSFLLSNDKGCVQFYFFFKNEIIEKVKMAYYPYPVELKEKQEEFENMLLDSDDEKLTEYYYDLWNIFSHNFELNVQDEELKKLVKESIAVGNNVTTESLLLSKFEYKYAVTNSSHLRIDYDANVISHHKCEIQIGAINNIRFPIAKIISPFTFFEFLMKNIYKEKYSDIISKSNYSPTFTNSKKIAVSINPFVEENIFLNHL